MGRTRAEYGTGTGPPRRPDRRSTLSSLVDVEPMTVEPMTGIEPAYSGLCQIYANELWHFELVTDAEGKCPPLLPNAAG